MTYVQEITKKGHFYLELVKNQILQNNIKKEKRDSRNPESYWFSEL